ncbi:RNA polymerase sigma-70 factor (family 1) [Pedobacter africanus]|uniref:RNA polymerase sigma-70 factor (ECF subfamily) n=1 Tax=Pedobacter africanus TaxID=151894 RepID=A0ACC6KX02_9SPHI|nr:RNA polymerase sigma-70 factor [Pedobacter africanus]MDR6783784.1 RNA polymerase sigma-70 factor (ECF subfamily) [Pedobacter africanus]
MAAYSLLSDLELTTLLKGGDKTAYTEIYDRYIWVLLDHAYNKLRNREESKDVVQEAFTLLWSKKELLKEDENLSGYLYTTVRNTILNLFAHRKVQDKYMASMEHFAMHNTVVATDHLVREHQLKALIETEIAALPPKMREVFELSRKANLSHKEIAEQLGISEQTVSKQVTNALKILKVKLGIYFYLLWLLYP